MNAPRTFSSLLHALRCPQDAGIVRIDDAFLTRYRPNIEWLVDRLAKSTAGVRGLIARHPLSGEASLEAAEDSPQLNLAVIGLIAQAYANYLQELAPDRHAVFTGYDARYFSPEFGEAFTRVFAGNGLRALRDRGSEPTPTPVSSFAAVSQGLGAAIQITASHNPPIFNGVKSSTWYGGVDTDDISERIAGHVRALTERPGAEIRLAPRSSELIREIDAKGVYLDRYLKPTFDRSALDDLREGMRRGARFLFDSLFGVGGMAIERYLDGLLPDVDWRRSVQLLNATPDPAIGGIEKPDPSEPATLELSGAIRFLTEHPDSLLSVTADMDADRIGTAVLLPAAEVERARTFGLFVSEFAGTVPSARGSVWAVRFTPNQLFTLIAYDRMLLACRQRLGTDDAASLRAAGHAAEMARLHLVTSIATSILAEKLARTFGLSLHLSAVGFKNLGRLAFEIDQRRAGDIILCLMEESGGAQVGPFAPWDEAGDTIHRDKDTCALALALFCLAARLRNRGGSLLDFYLEMAQQFGSLCYFERLDAYLPDQATAEDAARQEEATQAKEALIARLVALQRPENHAQLLELFGLRPAPEPAGTRVLSDIALMEKVGEEWQVVHPKATVLRLADGGRLEWFRGGTFDHDGMKITRYDSGGEARFWCFARASGTEALLRVYMEIIEPVDAPRPLRLIEVFEPLLRYLGLDDCGHVRGGPSYVDHFRGTVEEKYARGD